MLQLEKVDIVLGVIGHLYDRKNVLPHDAACLPEARVACCYCPAVPIKRQELTAQTTQKLSNEETMKLTTQQKYDDTTT